MAAKKGKTRRKALPALYDDDGREIPPGLIDDPQLPPEEYKAVMREITRINHDRLCGPTGDDFSEIGARLGLGRAPRELLLGLLYERAARERDKRSKLRDAGQKGAKRKRHRLGPRDEYLVKKFAEYQRQGRNPRNWTPPAMEKLRSEIRRQETEITEWYGKEKQAILRRQTSEDEKTRALRELDGERERRRKNEVFKPIKRERMDQLKKRFLGGQLG